MLVVLPNLGISKAKAKNSAHVLFKCAIFESDYIEAR